MYCLEDILVSLTLVIDGKAITKAVIWCIGRVRTNRQKVVLSLSKVAFIKVFFNDGALFFKLGKAVDLSPCTLQIL
jgi:hypothetical protein